MLVSEEKSDIDNNDKDAVSLKLVGGKLAPTPVYIILKKELLNFSEISSR